MSAVTLPTYTDDYHSAAIVALLDAETTRAGIHSMSIQENSMSDTTTDNAQEEETDAYITLLGSDDYIGSYPSEAYGNYLSSSDPVRDRLQAERNEGLTAEAERIEREVHDLYHARYLAEGARVKSERIKRKEGLEGLTEEEARKVMREGWNRQEELRRAFRAGWREGTDWLATAAWGSVIALAMSEALPEGACEAEEFAQGDDTRLYYRGGFLSAVLFVFEAATAIG